MHNPIREVKLLLQTENGLKYFIYTNKCGQNLTGVGSR